MAQNINLVNVAVNEIGNKATKYRTWYYGNTGTGIAWCAVFVSWCANQAGLLNKNLIVKTDGAGCFAREGVAKGWGKWYEGGTTPQPGDIITFCWNGLGRYPGQDAYFSDHVGIVEKVENGYVYTIEGNTGGTNDTSAVARKYYAIKNVYINGYYRPNWTDVTATTASTTVSTTVSTAKAGTTAIKSVQQWLNANYGTTCTVDGVYGPQTKSAIVGALQCYLNSTYKAGLRVDGVMGSATKAAIRNIKQGAKNTYVYLLQAALICHGYDTGGFDGEFGAKTLAAVKDWQSKNGLTVDGIAGAETFYSLLK